MSEETNSQELNLFGLSESQATKLVEPAFHSRDDIDDVARKQEEQPASAPKLPITAGRSCTTNATVQIDLAACGSLIVSGRTGSGKSWWLRGLLAEIFSTYSPQEIQLVLIDPKLVELSQFENLPHSRMPAAGAEEAFGVLTQLQNEMHERFRVLRDTGRRHFLETHATTSSLPLILLVLEEIDVILPQPGCQAILIDLVQRGRAAGICCLWTTQVPTAKGRNAADIRLRGNAGTRVSFRTANRAHSRLAIDVAGAEKLRIGQFLISSAEFPEPLLCYSNGVDGDKLSHALTKASERHSCAAAPRLMPLASSMMSLTASPPIVQQPPWQLSLPKRPTHPARRTLERFHILVSAAARLLRASGDAISRILKILGILLDWISAELMVWLGRKAEKANNRSRRRKSGR